MLAWHPDIFDNFVVPHQLDKQNIIDNILLKTMDMSVIYTEPTFLKDAIWTWSRMRIETWNKWWETTQFEYNPIDNYDRTETVTVAEGRNRVEDTDRKSNGSSSVEGSESYNSSDTGTVKRIRNYTDNGDDTGTVSTQGHESSSGETSGKQNDSGETLTSRAAFNETELVNVEQVENSGNQTSSGTSSSSGESSSTETRNLHHLGQGDEVNDETRDLHGTNSGTTQQSGTTQETETEKRTGEEKVNRTENIRAHGNIGVTTTQQMIQSERDIVAFNLSEIIVEEFIERFFILVY